MQAQTESTAVPEGRHRGEESATDRLRAAAEAWLADDPDPTTRAELRAVIDALPASADDLADRFAGPLTFGTAGLRGPVRAGLQRHEPRGRTGCRRRPRRLADGTGRPRPDRHRVRRPQRLGRLRRRDRARGDGLRPGCPGTAGSAADACARLCRPAPLRRGRRHGDGQPQSAARQRVQGLSRNRARRRVRRWRPIAPPADVEIEAAIRAVGPLANTPLGPAGLIVGPEIVEAYVRDTVAIIDVDGATRAVDRVHADARRRRRCGPAGVRDGRLRSVAMVAEQATPDPSFPTLPFPNPEEPGAMDLVTAVARAVDADIAIANDPDADRCAIAIPTGDGDRWRTLRGDEVGILLADHLMRRGRAGPVRHHHRLIVTSAADVPAAWSAVRRDAHRL